MVETKNNARDMYGVDQLTLLVKENLKEFNINDAIINTIIKSYINVKKSILINGDKVNEEGLGVQKMNYRGVTKAGFGTSNTRGFTVKVTADLSHDFKESAMDKLENDKEFEEKLKSN